MDKSIGILGGGQLAAMMTEAAIRLGVRLVTVLDPAGEDCPAARFGAKFVKGSFKNSDTVKAFCEDGSFDVVTVDIESVAIDGLKGLEGVKVWPSVNCLSFIQDKLAQRQFVSDVIAYDVGVSIKQPRFWSVDEFPFHDWCDGGKLNGMKFVIKSRMEGYDGKGVWFLDSANKFRELVVAFGGDANKFYIEEFIELEGEYAIITYNTVTGKGFFPIVKTVQEDGICTEVVCPSGLSKNIENKMRYGSELIRDKFESYGVMAIEMLLGKDGNVYLNEIAPRVHNSGHLTIEGCNVSQFEQHIRCILGMPVIEPKLIVGGTVWMHNLLAKGFVSSERLKVADEYKLAVQMAGIKNGILHWYGKKGDDSGSYKMCRKIGHITYQSLDVEDVDRDVEDVVRNVVMDEKPKIYIVMGSKSDLGIMDGSICLLREMGVECAVDVVSAHRSPEWMMEFGKEVKERGGKVIIAAAGGAAHLPGMLAAVTDLPVIGVPIPTKHLGGQDSLYSIVEMPDGVPVATVGIGKARNAAILALKICGMWDKVEELRERNLKKVEIQREEMKKEGLGLGW